jgi:hypothetical protein
MQIPFVGFQPVLSSEHMGVRLSLTSFLPFFPLFTNLDHSEARSS